MFSKITTIVALVSIAARGVVAIPPACLIAAVSNSTNPSDIKSVCSNSDSVQSYLNSNCGSSQQIAINAFSSACSSAGVTITTSASSSSTASASSSSSVSLSASTSVASSSANVSSGSDSSSATTTASGTAVTGSAGASGTLSTSVVIASGSTSAPAPTGSAKPATGVAARLGMDCVGLLALGAFGAMLAL